MNGLFTLQNVKDVYYTDLSFGLTERGFEQYLKENFTQVYDENLNFIGYERK